MLMRQEMLQMMLVTYCTFLVQKITKYTAPQPLQVEYIFEGVVASNVKGCACQRIKCFLLAVTDKDVLI